MAEDARLTVTVEPRPAGVRLRVAGELDLATAETLVQVATEQLRTPAGTFTVDLSGVPFCDSTGLSALIGIRRQCDETGWDLRLVHLTPTVHQVVVELSGLGEFLRVEPEPVPE